MTPNLKRKLLVAAVCAPLVWMLAAWAAARWLSVEEDLPRADAIIVLGGSEVYKERARYAAKLFHEGRAPIVVITSDGQFAGWSNERGRNPLTFERSVDELKHHGVSGENIEIVPQVVTGTYEECVTLREYAVQQNLRSLLIVTSAYHTRRARWSLRRVFAGSGIEIGIDGAPPGDQSPAAHVWWLKRRGWRVVAAEYVKMIYYQVHY